MNELLDKLIVRIIFALFICVVLVLYKYAHAILYPSSKLQIFKRFYPSKNSADTLHLFARLLGIAMIYSEFYFYMSEGILIALFDFLIVATAAFVLYLVSLYIIDAIVLYNFEYTTEILKRKNFSYALIAFTHSLGVAYLIKAVLNVSKDSLIIIAFLWLFAMVVLGFASKSYSFFSKLSFNKLLIQKSLALAFSYSGFIWGWVFIIASAMNRPLNNLWTYTMQTLLNIMLSIIIFPLFKKGIVVIFQIQNDLVAATNNNHGNLAVREAIIPKVGYGIYEGTVFFAACFLTSVITGRISFGTFYPTF